MINQNINPTKWNGIIEYLRVDGCDLGAKDLGILRERYISDASKIPEWDNFSYHQLLELATSSESFDKNLSRLQDKFSHSEETEKRDCWELMILLLSFQGNPRFYLHQNTYFNGKEKKIHDTLASALGKHPGYFDSFTDRVSKTPIYGFYHSKKIWDSIFSLTKSTVNSNSQTWRYAEIIKNKFKADKSLTYMPPEPIHGHLLYPVEFAQRYGQSNQEGIKQLKTIYKWIKNTDSSTRISKFYDETIDSNFDSFDNSSGAGQTGSCVLSFKRKAHAQACIRMLCSATRPPMSELDHSNSCRYFRISSRQNTDKSDFDLGNKKSTAGIVLYQLWNEGLETFDIEEIDDNSISFRFTIPPSGLFHNSRLASALHCLCFEMSKLDDTLTSRLLLPEDEWTSYDASRIAKGAFYVPYKDGRWKIGLLNRRQGEHIVEGDNAQLDKLVSQSECEMSALHKLATSEFRKFGKGLNAKHRKLEACLDVNAPWWRNSNITLVEKF